MEEETIDSLLKKTSLDEIEMWLDNLIAHATVKSQTGNLFSDWEREFINSVNQQYCRRHVAGLHDQPLSGKQLYYVYRLVDRLHKNSQAAIENVHKDTKEAKPSW